MVHHHHEARTSGAELGRAGASVRRALGHGAGLVASFEERAVEVRAEFAALAHRWDAELGSVEPRGSTVLDALEAMGTAAAAAVRRIGPTPLWALVAGASGGRLLSNTSSPIPAGG